MTVCAPAWLLALVAGLLAGPQAVRAVTRANAGRLWRRDEQERGDE